MASDHVLHKCVMVNDVPNFAFIIGYFSLAGQSWTCRADIAAFFFTKMLNFMRKNDITKLVPKNIPRIMIQNINLLMEDSPLAIGPDLPMFCLNKKKTPGKLVESTTLVTVFHCITRNSVLIIWN